MNVGILLPTRALLLAEERPQSAERLLSLAATAESSPVDSLWVGDSLTAKPRLEPLTTLAAIAARTERVRLGTAVLLAALRHPVTTSQVLGTLDLMSGGRLVIGAGVGGAFVDAQKREWRAVGIDPTQRASRLEEWVPIVKRLTRGETVDVRGKHYELESVRVAPTSPRRDGIPVLLATHWGTGGERQYRRAVELADGFIGISDSPGQFRDLKNKLGDLGASSGRNMEAFDSVFYMTVNIDDDEARAEGDADAFLRAYYGINIWRDKWGPWGAPGRIVERAGQYAAAGAQTLVFRFASLRQESQLDRFLRDVLPHL
jgi:alkanesulfonate monooxygenase SsuD/methylene tetrahydromethanopterin reductase-like flavin-dependent oxidoreductase (luciferase family)